MECNKQWADTRSIEHISCWSKNVLWIHQWQWLDVSICLFVCLLWILYDVHTNRPKQRVKISAMPALEMWAGCLRNRWLDLLHNDSSDQLSTVEQWSHAVRHGDGAGAVLWPSLALRSCWWWLVLNSGHSWTEMKWIWLVLYKFSAFAGSVQQSVCGAESCLYWCWSTSRQSHL